MTLKDTYGTLVLMTRGRLKATNDFCGEDSLETNGVIGASTACITSSFTILFGNEAGVTKEEA